MKLKDFSSILVTHIYTTGPPLRFADYLQKKFNTFILIGHPFPYTKDRRSFLKMYKEGELVLEKKFVNFTGPDLLFYVKDVLLTLWWIMRYVPHIDYFFGVDGLNFFSGFVLEKFHKVKKTIFYTMDYVPKRFENVFLNGIYHSLDSFAVKNCDVAWNLSSLMVAEREKKGVSKQYRAKQIVVPVGTKIIKDIVPFNKIDRKKIVFLGHLRDGQGVEMLIDSMSEVVKKIKQAHLLIIGGGPLERKFKKLVKEKKLKKSISFTGFVENFDDVEKVLKDATVAVAPYVDDEKTYTRYTDPTKPKDYMAAGIPVVITKVPQVAYEIEKNKCGLAIDYNKQDLAQAIIKLLSNEKLLRQYRENSLQMAKRYTWDKIFDKAMTSL